MEGKLRNMASVYIQKNNKILLLYRQGGRVINDVWVGSAGGHFETFELNDARACVLRELQEELGITEHSIENLRLRYVTLRRSQEEIRQNYYFFANIKEHVDDNLASNEGICRWFSLEDIASLEMPLSARYVMDHFCATGRHTDRTYVCLVNAERAEILELWES